jgi:hypothetical protein
MQALGCLHQLGGALGLRLATLAFAPRLTHALTSATQFADEPRLLVLGERSRDLSHHYPRGRFFFQNLARAANFLLHNS